MVRFTSSAFGTSIEARRDLFGGLVGEGEGADAVGGDAVRFDEEADPLDETERLPRARACYDEQRLRFTLDRGALRGGWGVHDIGRLNAGPHEGDVDLACQILKTQ